MTNTLIHNSNGKTIIADRFIEKRGKKVQSQEEKKQYFANACLNANYLKLQSQLLNYVSDNYLTSAEKQQLRKELLIIDSSFASLKSQSIELKFNLVTVDYNVDYLKYLNSYSEFKNFITPFLGTNNPETIDSSLMQKYLKDYYDAASQLEKDIFIVMYGATTRIDIELTTQFFVFDEEGNPFPDTQEIIGRVIAWGNTNDIRIYVNNIERTLIDNTIKINLNDILNLEEIEIKIISGNQNLIKRIGKIFNGKSVIEVQISSDNGDAFRTGQATTTLKALVFKGEKEITDSIASNLFNWKRKSVAENLEDERWNTSSKAIGKKEINITPEDTIGRTVFSCEVSI